MSKKVIKVFSNFFKKYTRIGRAQYRPFEVKCVAHCKKWTVGAIPNLSFLCQKATTTNECF